MGHEKTLNAGLCRLAPAVLLADRSDELADLARDLAAAGLVHQDGQAFPEAGTLPADSGTGKKNKQSQCDQQQEIDDSDGARTAADQLLDASHRGINEVRKQDGKQKKNERAPRGIKKAKTQRKQQSRKQNA